MSNQRVKLKDGTYVSQEWVMDQISRLKQMNLTNTAIASTLKLQSLSTVTYYWKKVQEQSFAERAKVPGSIVKGEVLEILKTLRTEAFSMINYVNKKDSPALFVTVLKTVKELVAEEVKFMMNMKMLKPEEDRIKLTIDESANLSLNELYIKLSEAKNDILDLGEKYLDSDPEDVVGETRETFLDIEEEFSGEEKRDIFNMGAFGYDLDKEVENLDNELRDQARIDRNLKKRRERENES